MKRLDSRRAAVAAGSVLLLAGLMVFRPGAGGHVAGPTGAGAAGDASGVRAALPATVSAQDSRLQFPTPYAYRDAGQEMFVVDASPAAKADDPYPVRVHLNRAGAERAASAPGGHLDVALPDGSRYPVTFERAVPGRGGNWTWIGRVESPLGNLAAVLTYGRDGVFGVLPAPDGRLFQLETSDGQAQLQPDTGIVPPGIDPRTPLSDVAPHPGRPSGALAAMGSFVPAEVPANVEIDVLGVYTTNLVQARGSVAAAETQFVNLLAVANQAFIDSGTVARFELVGLVETDYPGDILNATAIGDLHGNYLPDGLDVYAARDAVSADLVAMLRPRVPGDTSCGFADPSDGTLFNDWFAYSVTACGGYTLAHQFGHNLGSQHDWETQSSTGDLPNFGAYPFSFGYRQTAPVSFATIMAVPLPGQPTVGYFSSPENTQCLGAACGIAGAADNVRSINLLADMVSRYREPPNLVSVMGGQELEAVQGGEALRFLVRLSSPAPAGGVSFNIATAEGGTATAGADFTEFSQDHVIPEGQSTAWFSVPVLGDELDEDDESVLVRLTDVRGMVLSDSEAFGIIVDDDPYVTISGSLVSPGTNETPLPYTTGMETSFKGFPFSNTVFFDGADYSFTAPKGAIPILYVHFADSSPWFDITRKFGVIESDMVRDLAVERAAIVSGRLLLPDGDAPSGHWLLNLVESKSGSVLAWNLVGYPDFTYSFKTQRDKSVALHTGDVPPPYVNQRVELYTDGDVVQDIMLSKLPSLSIAQQRVEESVEGTHTIEVQVLLSTLAPRGGVTFDLVAEAGSATDGSDFSFEPVTLSIPFGYGSAWTSVVIEDDAVPEPDEEFRIVARNIQGAHMTSPGIVRILGDEEKAAANDFDADGKSDLVWRHMEQGRAALWGSGRYALARTLATVRDLEWEIVGTGDFDRDGEADLVWRHRGNGRNTIWRSGDFGAQLGMATVGNTDWEIAGTGDFDADLQSDILWRNRNTGANVIWRGADSRAAKRLTTVTDTGWRIRGVGDFDGDGRSDILWRHAHTGANVIWLKGDYRTQKHLTRITDLRWTIVGTGDFDGDGEDDVLWKHRQTGASVIWHSGERADQRSLTRVRNLDWNIVAVGDYDGDEIADIAWRHAGNGANTVWLGGDYARQMDVTAVRDTAWRVVH